MDSLMRGTTASPAHFCSLFFSGQSKPAIFLRRPFRSSSAYKQHALEGRQSLAVKVRARPEVEGHVPVVEKDEGLELQVAEEEKVTPEELEKMEAEAMEGKDEGRSPLDYDRRARIFYESSRVFGNVEC